MEAVYSRGPIAVSLDASQPGFRFYSGGVSCYFTECKTLILPALEAHSHILQSTNGMLNSNGRSRACFEPSSVLEA